MSITPTSFTFDQDTLARLEELRLTHGVPKSEILRRLINAYFDGLEVPGLPKNKRIKR